MCFFCFISKKTYLCNANNTCMQSKLFNRYVWLVNLLNTKEALTYNEIDREWVKSQLGDGKNFPLRTFHQHRTAIEELFGIEIACDASNGHKYYIANPDILKTVAERRAAEGAAPLLVGFAAETGDPVAEALRKCREKNLAMVVANDVTEPGAGFGTPTNRAALVRRDGSVRRLPLMSKAALARRIVRECEDLCS